MKKWMNLWILWLFITRPAQPQITEDFADGNLTNDPTWFGRTELFAVINSDSLQLRDSVASQAFLSARSDAISHGKWQIYVNLDFNPSTSNYSRIYLVSDRRELGEPLHGYYVQLGGSKDNISLYRQDSTGHTLIIEGLEDRIDTSRVRVSVQVIRDDRGSWELSAAWGRNGALWPEGSAFDDTYVRSTYFGLYCQYTSTRADKFFFDDIFVSGSAFQDRDPPVLISLQVTGDSTITLHFDEALDRASASNISNFLLLPQGRAPSSSVLVDSSMIEIQFDQPFENGRAHRLVYGYLSDKHSNISPSDTIEFFYLQEHDPLSKELIFSEIYPDPFPSQGLPESEFLEIFNRSQSIFNLEGWQLADASNVAELDSVLLFPGEYLVLVPQQSVKYYSDSIKTSAVTSWPALNNSGDQISLRSPKGTLIDQIDYSSNWHQSEKESGGYSLEIVDPSSPCPPQVNWTSSSHEFGGTPGFVNHPDTLEYFERGDPFWSYLVESNRVLQLQASFPLGHEELVQLELELDQDKKIHQATVDSVDLNKVWVVLDESLSPGEVRELTISGTVDCAGFEIPPTTLAIGLPASPASRDLFITEIMADPEPTLGYLPEVEYIEIWNPGSRLFDLGGVMITNRSDSAGLPAKLIYPNAYVVITSQSGLEQLDPNLNLAKPSRWLGLNQSGFVALLSNGGEIIDQVEYSSSWLPKESKGGLSLEIRRPDYPCEPAKNWAASESPAGGTPGLPNSIFDNQIESVKPIVRSVDLIDSRTLALTFDSWLDTSTLEMVKHILDPEIPIASFTAAALDSALLRFSATLDSSHLYRLQLDSLRSCSGIYFQSEEIPFGIGITPGRNDLLITEIMANPSPSRGLPEFEYLEIYNATDALLNMQGVAVSDLESQTYVPSTLIAPSEYLLLTSSPGMKPLGAFGRTIELNPWLNLNNDGDQLTLVLGSKDIFKIEYSRRWYDGFEKENGGFSLEMIDTNNPCGEKANWTASVAPLGGTPGQHNSVRDQRVDHRGPQVLQVSPSSDSVLVVRLSETINPGSVHPWDFTFQGWHVEVESTQTDANTVELKLSGRLTPGAQYTLEIDNISDCVGNLIEPSPTSYRLVIPEAAQKGDIQLSELLYDPPSGVPDFVEIYNTSERFISLRGWSMSNSEKSTGIVLEHEVAEELLIPPFSYKVFCAQPEILFNSYTHSDPSTFVLLDLPNFPNKAGQVLLYTPEFEIADHFDYSDDFHFALLKSTEGVSLERVSFDIETNEPGNWQSSHEDFGFASPGIKNSQSHPAFDGEESIEVVPEVLVPNLGNLVSIHYRFDHPGNMGSLSIFDLAGRKVKTLASNRLLSASGLIHWDGTDDDHRPVRAGLYLILFEWFNLTGQTYRQKKTVVVGF